MTKPLRVDEEAERELGEAITWYEETRPGLGADLFAAVEAVLIVVSKTPATGSLVPGLSESLPVRRLIVRRFPCSVVYLELIDEIRVLAFAHSRRRPGYWKNR